jgi:hypothetical protein
MAVLLYADNQVPAIIAEERRGCRAVLARLVDRQMRSAGNCPPPPGAAGSAGPGRGLATTTRISGSALRRYPTTRPAEERPQLVLGGLQTGAAARRQLPPRTIDVEGEHRHCRAERVRLAPPTALSRELQRSGDLARVLPREHAGLQVQGPAGLGYPLRPSRLTGCSHQCLARIHNGPCQPRGGGKESGVRGQ